MSHKCCTAALCNNCYDNRKDLIFHTFPLDERQKKIWEPLRMRRGDEKFVSNTSLFCCSEHFTAKDYKKSLTGGRHDLVSEICDLRRKVFLSNFGLERFRSIDDDIFFYTGFPNYQALIAFWNFVKPCA